MLYSISAPSPQSYVSHPCRPGHVTVFFFLISEVLGALFSVFIIWLVTGILCYMAIERIQRNHYKDVNADEMLVTASVGVVFNIV